MAEAVRGVRECIREAVGDYGIERLVAESFGTETELKRARRFLLVVVVHYDDKRPYGYTPPVASAEAHEKTFGRIADRLRSLLSYLRGSSRDQREQLNRFMRSLEKACRETYDEEWRSNGGLPRILEIPTAFPESSDVSTPEALFPDATHAYNCDHVVLPPDLEDVQCPDETPSHPMKRQPTTVAKLSARLKMLLELPLTDYTRFETRREVFDVVRALTTSFRPEEIDAEAIRPLKVDELCEVHALLHSEIEQADAGNHRIMIEDLVHAIDEVRAALLATDPTGTFSATMALSLHAVKLFHEASPVRLQLMFCYANLLWFADCDDLYMATNQTVLDACHEIVREQGEAAWDAPSEFAHAATLRRIKTMATSQLLQGLLYRKAASAERVKFQTFDYSCLVGLAPQYEQLMRDDPQAEFLVPELLVTRAHILRTAENHARRPTRRAYWRAEADRQWLALCTFLDEHFLTADTPERNARAIVDAVIDAAMGYASERTLDIVERALLPRKKRPGSQSAFERKWGRFQRRELVEAIRRDRQLRSLSPRSM